MQTPSSLRRFLPWLAVAVVLAYACAFQGSRAIYSPDEGRYTDVAIGMLEYGDWLTPMVHPEFVHMTNPPMTYWALGASLGLFGRSEFAARLPNALALAGTMFLLFWLGKRITPLIPRALTQRVGCVLQEDTHHVLARRRE